jgi:hypothetical protein
LLITDSGVRTIGNEMTILIIILIIVFASAEILTLARGRLVVFRDAVWLRRGEQLIRFCEPQQNRMTAQGVLFQGSAVAFGVISSTVASRRRFQSTWNKRGERK